MRRACGGRGMSPPGVVATQDPNPVRQLGQWSTSVRPSCQGPEVGLTEAAFAAGRRAGLAGSYPRCRLKSKKELCI